MKTAEMPSIGDKHWFTLFKEEQSALYGAVLTKYFSNGSLSGTDLALNPACFTHFE